MSSNFLDSRHQSESINGTISGGAGVKVTGAGEERKDSSCVETKIIYSRH